MDIKNLSTLKIHKLSQEQYNRELAAGRIDENAIYLTPDNNSNPDGADIVLDATLTKQGEAADAKAVGDKFTTFETEIKTYIDETILGGKW